MESRNKVNLRQLIWWNRQPTLWSHSCPVTKVVPRDDDECVFGTSPLSIEPLNMDFDGDTAAVYVNHCVKALKQMEERAYLENTVFYDSKDDFLSTIRHEALYSAYILTRTTGCGDVKFSVEDLKSLPEEIYLFNDSLSSCISVNGSVYSYGVCLFNKWCGFNEVILNEPITKKQIQKVSRKIYEHNRKQSKDFYDALFELEKKLMFFITVTNHIPTLSLFEMISLVDDKTHALIQKIPDGNAYISYHINNGLTDRCIDQFPQDLGLYKLYKSGSRFSKTQLARSCIDIGLLADEKNVVHQNPIRTSLIEGLTAEEFFQSAPGTRKGKQKAFIKKLKFFRKP